MMKHARSFFLALAAGSACGVAHGQCPPTWAQAPAGGGFGGGDPYQFVLWDHDGDGGTPPLLAAAGTFLTTDDGAAVLNRVALWDGVVWGPLGEGVNNEARTISTMPDGSLVVGGAFTSAGTVAASRVARWDASANDWAQVGGGLSSIVLALAPRPSAGELIAAGFFATPSARVAAYDGAGWGGLGDGVGSTAAAAAVNAAGNVFIGGSFTAAGGNPANRIAMWDGSAWSGLGEGTSGLVRCILVMPNGDIIVGGAFATAGSTTVNNIARWDGTEWHAYGTGTNSDVHALALMPDGRLMIGGMFTRANGHAANRLAMWSGSDWEAVGEGTDGLVRCLAVLPSGEIAVGGSFANAGGMPSPRFARLLPGTGTVPTITQQPSSQVFCPTPPTSATFSVEASGDGPLTYNWQIESPPGEWITLSTIPSILECGDASNAVADPAEGPTTTITVTGCPGPYTIRAVVSGTCGAVNSEPAQIIICNADFNCDGFLDFFDPDAFIAAFDAGEDSADFNRDGFLDFFDADSFVGAFEAGC